MHITAFNNLRTFHAKYVAGNSKSWNMLDVGSMAVKEQDIKVGSVRELFKNTIYVGLDIAEGKNVDVVYDGKTIPFENESFSIVISTSCFEHDPAFWNTFKEIIRVVKKGGLIYLNAPSSGHVHRYPVDCWRFYPDAWQALADDNEGVTLLEQYMDDKCYWKNNVGIFRKA
jgi:SAM-dependent methyltransferase